MTPIKIKIPENCFNCQLSYLDGDAYFYCAIFNTRLKEPKHNQLEKCPECLSKAEVEIEYE